MTMAYYKNGLAVRYAEAGAIAEYESSLPAKAEAEFQAEHEEDERRAVLLKKLVELDLRKPEITAYYEELKTTVAAVAEFIPLNGYFKANDGTVFKIVKPTGTFISFKDLDYERTKREGEARGSLSMKEAKDAEANGFAPLPE